ncbi:carboxypeptidase-like regulatory domain-containing protein [Solitalea sp. MAHUQ-68]|uniref:Carboxypeptidase-like regulatory domain-containing protein n=1 Tax=Solitalea agri TaxID=2953739 RepID=A0A9X2F088_9SPHI|nr:carboxypeptidase-like regulatory domain-containing protein [Solitalea agri]MCO4291846.1 carboxypeptidase-like regulatory domain-containing protein [Solitalea agri]
MIISYAVRGQGILSGKIYDREKAKPMEFVQVYNKTIDYQLSSDREGNYKVYVKMGDTILFSALGYETQKIIIDKSLNFLNKNIYMQTRTLSLPEVMVSGKKSYKADSAEVREDYARVFNYKDKSTGNLIGTAIFHPLSFIEYLYSGKKRQGLRSFQSRIVDYEHEKFIDNYYNPVLIKKIVKIDSDAEMEAFMKFSRPEYEFIKSANQYDIYTYISTSYKKFKETGSKADSTSLK